MIYIRVDMNPVIATGHLMRCLAIADAARDRGIETTFILADENAVSLLEEKKYRYIVLNTKWDELDGELATLISVIETEKIEKLFIDSYKVTATYLKALTDRTYTIYLDDLNLFTYPVNAIICYANYYRLFCYEDNYRGSEYKTKIYEGCQYAPLRGEFQNIPEKQIRDSIENVLIMSGGTDQYNVIDKILEVVSLRNYNNIYVMCGRYSDKYDYLQQKYKLRNIHIYKSKKNLVDYMKKVDLAISAGGTTLYELCACGTPTITYAIADNQYENVYHMQQDGIMKYIGDARCEQIEVGLKQCLDDLYVSQSFRSRISKKMQESIDGKGANRIVNIIVERK